MKLYYTGSDAHLKELGFLQNIYETYWFLPNLPNGYCLIINVPDYSIEYYNDKCLEIIKDYIKEK